jgi:hypothetical protein
MRLISHQSLSLATLMMDAAAEPVYTVSLCSAIPGLAVSGGGDDQAYLWHTDSGETKSHLAGACTTTTWPSSSVCAHT